jgi:hypothetical protein
MWIVSNGVNTKWAYRGIHMTDVLFQLHFVCHRLLPHFLFEYVTLSDKRKIYKAIDIENQLSTHEPSV